MIYHELRSLLEQLEDGQIPEDHHYDREPDPLTEAELICLTTDEVQQRAEKHLRDSMGSYAAAYRLHLYWKRLHPNDDAEFPPIRQSLLKFTGDSCIDPALAMPLCEAVLDKIEGLLEAEDLESA